MQMAANNKTVQERTQTPSARTGRIQRRLRCDCSSRGNYREIARPSHRSKLKLWKKVEPPVNRLHLLICAMFNCYYLTKCFYSAGSKKNHTLAILSCDRPTEKVYYNKRITGLIYQTWHMALTFIQMKALQKCNFLLVCWHLRHFSRCRIWKNSLPRRFRARETSSENRPARSKNTSECPPFLKTPDVWCLLVKN